LIDSKTASLDTLYGGLTQRAGGGHQTKSLRLTDPDGKVRNASCKEECRSILQNVAFKINTSQ
jgi:hypothetical protein